MKGFGPRPCPKFDGKCDWKKGPRPDFKGHRGPRPDMKKPEPPKCEAPAEPEKK